MADYKGDWNDLFTFVELQQPGSGADKDASNSVTNDAFALYPQSSRTVGLTKRSTGTNLEQTTQLLPKGFIRNLITKQGGELAEFPNIRCNFQFNPQDIQHQIEARKDMYLPILQDPSQLAQPMAGNATFAFELIFDRTMEVNSRFSYNDPSNTGMPDPNSAETVGVFHDLRVLHSIIGQGLSSELMDAQLAKLNRDVKKFASLNYKQLNIRATQGPDDAYVFTALTSEGTTTTVDADRDLNSRNTVNFLTNIDSELSATNDFMANLNVGNSAFLIPQPCRVIFSPMFMVDGFVMNTNVLFTKFSAKMIPIQCKVHLQMQAVYIGFARSKTFITEQIAETERQNDEEQTAYDTNLTDIESLLKYHLNTITVGYNSDQRILSDDGPINEIGRELESVAFTKAGGNTATFGAKYQPFWMFATKDFWYNRDFGIIGGSQTLQDTKPLPAAAGEDTMKEYSSIVLLDWENPSSTPYGSPGITVKLCMNKDGADNIAKLIFEDMSSDNPVLDIAVKSHIYGPFTQTDALAFESTVSPMARDLVPPNTCGIYSGGCKISTKKDWEKFTKIPLNWTLALPTYDPMHNGANKGSYPINIQTTNSTNKSVIDTLNEKIQELDHYNTDAVNARGLYIQNSTNNRIEVTDPAWRTDIPSSNTQMGYNAVPLDLYYTLPDSLLYLVEETHQLNDKYFVVITASSITYNITGPGDPIGKGLVAKRVSIVKGDTTNLIVDTHPAS